MSYSLFICDFLFFSIVIFLVFVLIVILPPYRDTTEGGVFSFFFLLFVVILHFYTPTSLRSENMSITSGFNIPSTKSLIDSKQTINDVLGYKKKPDATSDSLNMNPRPIEPPLNNRVTADLDLAKLKQSPKNESTTPESVYVNLVAKYEQLLTSTAGIIAKQNMVLHEQVKAYQSGFILVNNARNTEYNGISASIKLTGKFNEWYEESLGKLTDEGKKEPNGSKPVGRPKKQNGIKQPKEAKEPKKKVTKRKAKEAEETNSDDSNKGGSDDDDQQEKEPEVKPAKQRKRQGNIKKKPKLPDSDEEQEVEEDDDEDEITDL